MSTVARQHEDALTRPYVVLNMASSLDGKITTRKREVFSLGSAEDRALMNELRAGADAVLIGAGTLLDEDPPLLVSDPILQARRVRERGAPHPLNVLVSASVDLDPAASRFFNCPSTERLVFTTQAAPCERMRAATKHADVCVVPQGSRGRVDLEAVLAELSRRGIERLLLEGGGTLNFSMLKAGFIDEICLTLCPFIIGGRSAPTTFEGTGFLRASIRHLELSTSRIGEAGEVFLRYWVKNNLRARAKGALSAPMSEASASPAFANAK